MPISGTEDGVKWQWTNNLTLDIVPAGNATDTPIRVAPHPVHEYQVGAVDSNYFYGGFTIVYKDGTVYSPPSVFEGKPTKAVHTEPQYFEWLRKQFDDMAVIRLIKVCAFILEINQTNTPFSQVACRKAILEYVRAKSIGMTIARMSAYQIYSQYPKVCPTSMEIEKHAESQLARYVRVIKAAETMTDTEKAELATWEKNHVTGDGAYATSDWPGWNAIESRISH